MNLSTTYLGLELKNPLVPSAGPLSKEISTIRQMEDAGAAAVVMYSLFEEQIRFEAEELDHYLSYGTESFAEALTYFPHATEYHLGPEEYLEHIARAKEAVDIPIIGSMNGVSVGGWIDYAGQIEAAGADALELNVYFIVTDAKMSGQEMENRYVSVLGAVKEKVNIPVAVKLSPFFTALPSMARRLDSAGADGLVLFNRFYQPDFDLENLEVAPNLVLSSSHETRLPLRWIAILYGQVQADLAATTGVSTAEDVLKMLMAGADVTQLCSILLKRGIGTLTYILEDMTTWLEEHEYESVEQMKGSMSQKSCKNPAAFERANYMKTLNSYV